MKRENIEWAAVYAFIVLVMLGMAVFLVYG